MILELGGNDALRGLPLSMTQANLAQMAQAAKSAGARVLIVGMQVPPNYGRKYSDDFAALFAAVAKKEDAASYASGLLIGADVRIGLSIPTGAQIAVIGRPELTDLYATAIAATGREVVEHDGEGCFLARGGRSRPSPVRCATSLAPHGRR